MLALFQLLPSLVACLLGLVFYNQEKINVQLARLTSLVSLGISLLSVGLFMNGLMDDSLQLFAFELPTLNSLGASFSLQFGGLSLGLSVLTSLAFCVAFFLPLPQTVGKRVTTYFSLLHLCQFALYGVFMSNDALFFYVFWELTLIPIYFLSSFFGGERRVEITFSFFLYTFLASVLLLVGIIYLYSFSELGSFAHEDFVNSNIKDSPYGGLIFWMMFIAFAVKTPIFPFHGWQAPLYKTAPTPLTLILSSVVAKMGLFAVFYWLLPIFQFMLEDVCGVLAVFCVVGVVYGAIQAMSQKNLKTLLAYSSLSHLSLMMFSFFTGTTMSMEGALFQMVVHGIVNVGLWFVVCHLERAYGSTDLEVVRGVVRKDIGLAFGLLLFALANIGLPLTANFVGEWMMFAGILGTTYLSFSASLTSLVVAGLSVILGAVYTLQFLKTVLYGEDKSTGGKGMVLAKEQYVMMGLLLLIVVALGVYPQGLFKLFAGDVQAILEWIQNRFY